MLVFILELLFLVTLGAIVFEDFAERRIHLFLFLIGYILTVMLTLKKGMHIEFLIVNFLFVVINIVAILGYCFIKKQQIKVASEWVGLGDILMWGMLIFYFSPFNFILFFMGYLIISRKVLSLRNEISSRPNGI